MKKKALFSCFCSLFILTIFTFASWKSFRTKAQETKDMQETSGALATTETEAINLGQVAFRTFNNRNYISAVGGGGGGVSAAGGAVDVWETFRITDINGGSLNNGDAVYIQSRDAHYLRAYGNGVTADQPTPGSYETFTVKKLSAGSPAINFGDTIGLRIHDGRHVNANEGGGREINLSAPLGQWGQFILCESFVAPTPTPTPTPTPSFDINRVAFRTQNGSNYMTAPDGGGGVVMAEATQIGSSEIFRITDIDGGNLEGYNNVYLQTTRGRYLRSTPSGNYIWATSEFPGDYEKFKILKIVGGGSVGGVIEPGDTIAFIAWRDYRNVIAQNGGGSFVHMERNSGSHGHFTLLPAPIPTPTPVPSPAPPPPPDPVDLAQVAFRASNGYNFVSVANSDLGGVNAGAFYPVGNLQSFSLINISRYDGTLHNNNLVQIQSRLVWEGLPYYLSARDAGYIAADERSPGAQQKFLVTKVNGGDSLIRYGDTVRLLSWTHNDYVTASDGGGGGVNHQQAQNNWHEFVIYPGAAPPPTPCAYAISPTPPSTLPQTGGSSERILVSVTSGSYCQWRTTSSASWIRERLGGVTHTGTDYTMLDWEENPTYSPRSATINIAGQTFNITQYGRPTVTGLTVAFRTVNNTNYVGVTGGVGEPVRATSTDARSWETFSILDRDGGDLRDGDQVYIKASDLKYLRAVNGGGGALTADAVEPREWETFTIFKESQVIAGEQSDQTSEQPQPQPVESLIRVGDTIRLRTWDGTHYVTAVNGGGSVVRADGGSTLETPETVGNMRFTTSPANVPAGLGVVLGGYYVGPPEYVDPSSQYSKFHQPYDGPGSRLHSVLCELDQLNAKWIRIEYRWDNLGAAIFQRISRTARANGKKVIMVVQADGVHYPHTDSDNPEDTNRNNWINGYINKIQDAIRDTDPDAIEVGNEPNGPGIGINDNVSIPGYTFAWLMRKVMEKKHAERWRQTIISGGILNTYAPPWVEYQPHDSVWWRRFLESKAFLENPNNPNGGRRQIYDYFGIHPYNPRSIRMACINDPNPPPNVNCFDETTYSEEEVRWKSRTAYLLGYIRDELNNATGGNNRKPFVVTEFGWQLPTDPDSAGRRGRGRCNGEAKWNCVNSVEQMRDGLVAAYDVFFRLSDTVHGALWYNYRDEPTPPDRSNDFYRRFGLRFYWHWDIPEDRYVPKWALWEKFKELNGGSGSPNDCWPLPTPTPTPTPSCSYTVRCEGYNEEGDNCVPGEPLRAVFPACEWEPDDLKGKIRIVTGSSCGWRAREEEGWFNLTTDVIGSGEASVEFRLSPNTTNRDRTGYIYVDYPYPNPTRTITFTVYQIAAGCRLDGGEKSDVGVLGISDALLPLPQSSVFDPIRLWLQRDAVSLRR